MAETVTLEFLARQLERVLSEQTSIREDLRVLTAIVMRHDASLSAIIEQLRGMTAQFQRFDARLRRLEGETGGE
jgi:hypothetical protein